MIAIRAKMEVLQVVKNGDAAETVTLTCVAKAEYPEDGSDADNSFALFAPTGQFWLSVTNPAAVGQFKEGDVVTIDINSAS